MIVKQSRSRLDTAIDPDGDITWVVLLSSGADGSTAEQIHEYMGDKGLEPWRKYFLITDLDVLTESERNEWFGGANTEWYAVLKQETKEVVCTGPVSELLRVNGKPSILNIRKAFIKGEGDNQ